MWVGVWVAGVGGGPGEGVCGGGVGGAGVCGGGVVGVGLGSGDFGVGEGVRVDGGEGGGCGEGGVGGEEGERGGHGLRLRFVGAGISGGWREGTGGEEIEDWVLEGSVSGICGIVVIHWMSIETLRHVERLESLPIEALMLKNCCSVLPRTLF